VRASVRAFVDEHVLPIIGKCYVDGRFPRSFRRWRSWACSARICRRARMRRAEQRRVWGSSAGGRGVQACVVPSAGRAGHVSDLRVRQRGAAGEVSPKMASGEIIGCFD
jgi:hypothetical protein